MISFRPADFHETQFPESASPEALGLAGHSWRSERISGRAIKEGSFHDHYQDAESRFTWDGRSLSSLIRLCCYTNHFTCFEQQNPDPFHYWIRGNDYSKENTDKKNQEKIYITEIPGHGNRFRPRGFTLVKREMRMWMKHLEISHSRPVPSSME